RAGRRSSRRSWPPGFWTGCSSTWRRRSSGMGPPGPARPPRRRWRRRSAFPSVRCAGWARTSASSWMRAGAKAAKKWAAMFTGLAEAVGRIEALVRKGEGLWARIQPSRIDPRSLSHGESVAVDGCCLTVVETGAEGFAVEISPETLARTTMGGLGVGSRVNLERALALGDRLGGHLVLGHVDAVGTIESRVQRGDFEIGRAHV